jgi:hypothetical protein
VKTVFLRDEVTAVLTSCGRWDFLIRSIDTFLAHHEPARFILIEDSGDTDFAQRIAARYPAIEVVLNQPRLGQHAAIDRAYGMVNTPFIVHLEDDWVFTGAMDIADARQLLDANPSVASVCFTVFRLLKWRQRVFARTFRHGSHLYASLHTAHREWHGHSFYPTLVRRRTWEEHGPYASFQNERAISRHMKGLGLFVAYQLPGVGIHVGSGRSVFDPARVGERRRITGGWRRWLAGKGPFSSAN